MKRKTSYSTKAEIPLRLADHPGPISPAAPPEEAMVRTQIYLRRSEHEFLMAESARRGEPMAAILRDWITEKMALPDEVWDRNPLLAPPADPAFRGPKDGVLNHDHHISGAPRKWVRKKGRWVEAPPLPADYYTNPARGAAYDRALEEGR